ncbi:MAG TPA: TetR/AcrR family transcriptional regulator [Thermoanaerobaculia bacterium]
MPRKTKEEVLEEFRCASIQEAAMKIIARKGAGDATMQDIADEAGISKATLYAYFRDRDELLAKTAAAAYARLVDSLEEAFQAPGTLEERLSRIVLRQLSFFDEHRALFSASLTNGKKKKSPAYDRYMQQLETLFAEAKERGELRDLVPSEVAVIYADLVKGVVIRRLEEKSKTPREAQAAFIIALLLRGVSGEPRNEA